MVGHSERAHQETKISNDKSACQLQSVHMAEKVSGTVEIIVKTQDVVVWESDQIYGTPHDVRQFGLVPLSFSWTERLRTLC
jgi:hypothetical protein